jgi:hypothetical protein
MNDRERGHALERRYDGPIPSVAAISADHATPWTEQLSNRRSLAWTDVRRIARQAARSGRALRATGESRHYRDWIRLRHELGFALRSWAAYRDWARSAVRSGTVIIPPGRTGIPPPNP